MARGATGQHRGQKGLALVSVLWLLLLLSVMASGTLRDSRTRTFGVRNGLEATKARLLADAGVQRALLALLDGEQEATWRSDGTPYLWRFADGEVRISIRDEAGRIDLNQAPPRLLAGLFLAAGIEPRQATALADSVADFRDDNHLRRLNGAEDEDYGSAGVSWGAKDAPFDRVAELRQVLGMTPSLFERIEHSLTVRSARPSIDPWTAPRLALLAVPGLDPAAVEAFLERRGRREHRNDPGGRSIASLFGRSELLSEDGGGAVFELQARARSDGGARFVRRALVGITSLGGAPFRVEGWEQGRIDRSPEDAEPR